MSTTLQDLMRNATQLTQSGRLTEATQVIQRALASAGLAAAPKTNAPVGEVIDVQAVEVLDDRARPQARRSDDTHATTAGASFTSGSHSHAGLTRGFKLFLPAHNSAKPLPLVVMLHGCTQDPDDFAAGTGMNTAAQAQGFAVLYPAQAQDANPQRCWNWFKHNHQRRGRGEAALIASLVQSVVAKHGLDAGRVGIAGLSAGGAMAALVAAAHPELFAAVGVHSGLAPGAAADLPSALAAMRSGAAGALPARLAVPLIVFHGDQDQVVHPRNGEQLLAAAPAGQVRVERGVSAGGQRYTRTVVQRAGGADADTPHLAEHWLLHGAGHAWAGGHAAGSYTDGRGPDASAEMLRFFFGQGRRVGA